MHRFTETQNDFYNISEKKKTGRYAKNKTNHLTGQQLFTDRLINKSHPEFN